MIRPSSFCCASYGESSARDYSSSDLFVRKEAGESKISTAMGDCTSIVMKGEETCFMDEPDCNKIQLQQCDFNIIEGHISSY
ncbi:hypothetical protein L1049_008306 [Liquidambar formosana]|uniref:Uncharacterized protein n=1 Tax=Liquidambar formosana TaxID=63359 RepID=A0AAP0X934_LIQFO